MLDFVADAYSDDEDSRELVCLLFLNVPDGELCS